MLKKLLVMLIVLMIGVSTYGCKSNTESNEEKPAEENNSEEIIEDEREIVKIENFYHGIVHSNGEGVLEDIFIEEEDVINKTEEEILKFVGNPSYTVNYNKKVDGKEIDGKAIGYRYSEDLTGTFININNDLSDAIHSDEFNSTLMISSINNRISDLTNTYMEGSDEKIINEISYMITENENKEEVNIDFKYEELIGKYIYEGLGFTQYEAEYILEYREIYDDIIDREQYTYFNTVKSHVGIHMYKIENKDKLAVVVTDKDLIIDYYEEDILELNSDNAKGYIDKVRDKIESINLVEVESNYYVLEREGVTATGSIEKDGLSNKTEEEIKGILGESSYNIDYDIKINRENSENGTFLSYKHEVNSSGIFVNVDEKDNDYVIVDLLGPKYIGVDILDSGINSLLDITKDIEESEDAATILHKKSYLFSEASGKEIDETFGSDIIGVRADQLNEKFGYEYHNCIEYKETVGNNLKKHIVIMVSKLEDSKDSGFIIIRDGLVVDYFREFYSKVDQKEYIMEVIQRY